MFSHMDPYMKGPCPRIHRERLPQGREFAVEVTLKSQRPDSFQQDSKMCCANDFQCRFKIWGDVKNCGDTRGHSWDVGLD